ncbi:hypothetical protein [Streptomyces sp. NPDC050535]|uniref:hypothetical protein n=1 Tax=Streptomyces sp. NPDC050535 TaxID=3365626 RepID=UPI003792AB5F
MQRLVDRTGLVMVAHQLLVIGYPHRGKVVNVVVEDTHFRVVHEGKQLGVYPSTSEMPVTSIKAWPGPLSRKPRQGSLEDGPQVSPAPLHITGAGWSASKGAVHELRPGSSAQTIE